MGGPSTADLQQWKSCLPARLLQPLHQGPPVADSSSQTHSALPCRNESTAAGRQHDRLAQATPGASCMLSMGRSWSLGLYTQPKAACQIATGTEGMSVLAKMKGHACSTSMASRRRLCLITCTSACGNALAPLLDCHDFCTLSSPQQLHGMPLLERIPEPTLSRWGRDTRLIFVAQVTHKGCDRDPTHPPDVAGSNTGLTEAAYR